jgi:hypothetical protein
VQQIYSLLMYLTLILCINFLDLVWSILDASAEKNPVNETSEEKQRAQHEFTSVDQKCGGESGILQPPSRLPVRHAIANPTGDDLAGRRISSWPCPCVRRASHASSPFPLRTSSPAVRSPRPVVPSSAGQHRDSSDRHADAPCRAPVRRSILLRTPGRPERARAHLPTATRPA